MISRQIHLRRELTGAVTAAYQATMMECLKRLDEAGLLNWFLGETAIENQTGISELQTDVPGVEQLLCTMATVE